MAKKKRKSDEAVPVSEARGVASFDTDEIILLVAASVEDVAPAFKERRKLNVWLKNAIGRQITVTNPSFVVYRLKGHSWTIIDHYNANAYPDSADAESLSKSLKTKVIYYGNSDTAGATGYELWENGKRLERFESFEEIEFESSIRPDAEPPEPGPQEEDFVQEFMKAQDALAPSWTTYFGSFCHDVGDTIKFEIIPAELLERLDYLSAEPKTPKKARTAKAGELLKELVAAAEKGGVKKPAAAKGKLKAKPRKPR